MNWINIAVLSAATMAVVHIFDSHLLSKRIPSVRAYLLPVGSFQLLFGYVLFTMFPLPEGISIWPVLVALTGAAFRISAMIIMFETLKKEEVSKVVPVIYTYPIFVAILAMPLLGESLIYLEWLAIVIVVAGAILVSVKKSPTGSHTWPVKLLFFLFGSSLLFALSDVSSKYALVSISFWNMAWLSTFSMGGIMMLISLRPHIIRQLLNLKQRNLSIGLLVFTSLLAQVGTVLLFVAIESGPVSLVSTVVSTRPLFVLLFAIVLSRLSPMFLDWHATKSILGLRIVATIMIVGGIIIIHLT